MIQQTKIGLNSRSEAYPYNENGFLPLITAPMYSVVNEQNWDIFYKNKINVCLPRKCVAPSDGIFHSLSLADFKEWFITGKNVGIIDPEIPKLKSYICIDTANGNIPDLHTAIKKAKELHGDNLVIMAGNVASVEAFVELAKTGVDYIRLGIGGGGGCNTTSNTGVGQEDLELLIKRCFAAKELLLDVADCGESFNYEWYSRYSNSEWLRHEEGINNLDEEECKTIGKVKIAADGISSYIKQCETKYGFNDNGYAAINKLLFAGADLVMIGKLFTQCLESAGEKALWNPISQIRNETWDIEPWDTAKCEEFKLNYNNKNADLKNIFVKYSGMSTQKEQKKYRKPDIKINDIFYLKTDVYDKQPIKCTAIEDEFVWGIVQNCPNCKETGYSWLSVKNNIKPSEGSVSWIPVRWSLNEWLNGSDEQDSYPYLMGYINSLKSAMAYTNNKSLFLKQSYDKK